ncbi:hypothetical protein ILP97_15550 [Amycolatopsis sp. H6(2020)]|nr:hypothetical protein [Amycolatopsis sp. H6(2020)]
MTALVPHRRAPGAGPVDEEEQDRLIALMIEYGRLDRALQLLRDTAYRPQAALRRRLGRWRQPLQEAAVLSLLEHGCFGEARALLDVYVERVDVQWAWPHLVDLLIRGGETDTAAGQLDRLRALAEVADYSVSLTLVEALLQADQVTEALDLFNRVGQRQRPTGALLPWAPGPCARATSR